MRNSGLDEAQAGIKIVRRNTNNLRYADGTTLMAESEELKNLLMKVKDVSCVRRKVLQEEWAASCRQCWAGAACFPGRLCCLVPGAPEAGSELAAPP